MRIRDKCGCEKVTRERHLGSDSDIYRGGLFGFQHFLSKQFLRETFEEEAWEQVARSKFGVFEATVTGLLAVDP